MPPYQGQTPAPPVLTPNFGGSAPKQHSLRLKIAVGVLGVLLMIMTILAVSWLGKYNDAKTVSDATKAAVAAAAKAEQQKADDAAFTEQQKDPYRTYTAPTTMADLVVAFPKSWNLFAVEDAESDEQIDLFFNPGLVKSAEKFSGDYALRLQLTKTSYADTLDGLKEQVADGSLKASGAKVSGLSGTRYSGAVAEDKKGVMVVLPVRDKSLLIWTEGSGNVADFNKILDKLKVRP